MSKKLLLWQLAAVLIFWLMLLPTIFAQNPAPALIKITVLVSNVTTNTTSVPIPLPKDLRTIEGQVVCSSGACTQTQAIYGDIDNDPTNGKTLLCTITLSGTPRANDVCPPILAVFNYYFVETINTTGTGAAGAVYAMY